MATNTQPQPVVASDLQPGDRRLMRDLASRYQPVRWRRGQAVRLIALGYIVRTAAGYEITNAGREKIKFAKIEG